MDAIAALHHTQIDKIFEPTLKAASALHEQRRAEIESIPRHTFRYGDDPRHLVDVYYPPETPGSGSQPLLFFVPGGGFVEGARQMDDTLIYCNVGAFFAARGFLTLIPDYRLLPQTRWPGGAEDVRDVIRWAVSTAGRTQIAQDEEKYDWEHVNLIGHSAGANHVVGMLLAPDVLPLGSAERTWIRKAVLLGAPYHFRFVASAVPPGAAEGYYGEEIRKTEPLGQLERADAEILQALPPVFFVESEFEPPTIKQAGKDWRELWAEKVGNELDGNWRFGEGKGHNHLSLSWFTGSGEGGEWAGEVDKWLLGDNA